MMHYDVRGSGPIDLMLLHGMGSSDTWRPLLSCLDYDRVRAVTCDLRGHGRSEGGAERYTYPQLNADLLAIADAAGMESFVLVGFSGSCKNAVWFACRAARARPRTCACCAAGSRCRAVATRNPCLFF